MNGGWVSKQEQSLFNAYAKHGYLKDVFAQSSTAPSQTRKISSNQRTTKKSCHKATSRKPTNLEFFAGSSLIEESEQQIYYDL